MNEATKICIYAELAKENGHLTIQQHEGVDYYVAQIKSGEQIMESRLIRITTSPMDIRNFLTEWVRSRQQIIEKAKSMCVVKL